MSVVMIQNVAEANIVDESGSSQFDIDIADDASITFPAGAHPQFDLVGSDILRARDQIGYCDFNLIASFLAWGVKSNS